MVTVMKRSLIAMVLLFAGVVAWAAQEGQRPPLSKDEVLEMLKGSVPSRVVADVIRQYGIGFRPTASVVAELRKAGADDTVVEALKKFVPEPPAAPLGQKDILIFLAEGVASASLAQSVEQRGIDFQPSEEYLSTLQSQGAETILLDALRHATPTPFTKQDLTQLLAARVDQREIVPKLAERGIDFEPNPENLGALRAAGASETLLQAVRGAKRRKAPVPQEPSAPNALNLHQAGGAGEVAVQCRSAESMVPVFGSSTTDSVADHLRCGERVTILEKDSHSPGIDRIQYGGGKAGYIWDFYLGGFAPEASVGADVTPPRRTFTPDPPYPEGAGAYRKQGVVRLLIVVNRQGNVIDVQEISAPLGDGFDESAIETVKGWKFTPAMRGSAPITVRIMVEVSFRLRLEGKPAS